MTDAYCNKPQCKAPMDGDEFGLSIMDCSTKEEYIHDLQRFHDAQHHTTLEERLTCKCGHKSKDATETLDHYVNCSKSGYGGK